MQDFDPGAYTSPELAALIQAAAGELQRRLMAPQAAAAAEPIAKARPAVPSEADQAFVDEIRALTRAAKYVTAVDRARIADLAKAYPDWMAGQGLPLTRSTGEWRKMTERIRAIRKAKGSVNAKIEVRDDKK